jgi:hypothetical protein
LIEKRQEVDRQVRLFGKAIMLRAEREGQFSGDGKEQVLGVGGNPAGSSRALLHL